MQCRNCEHYSDNEFRYCPRCGAPSSLGWPMAGAPWLRRPAAIAGFGILIVAWLFALQRALWMPDRAPEPGKPMVSTPERAVVRTPDATRDQDRRTGSGATQEGARRESPAKAPVSVAVKPAAAERAADRSRWAVKARRVSESRVAIAPTRPRPQPVRSGQTMLAAASVTITPRARPASPRRTAPPRPRAQTRPASRPTRARVGSWRAASTQGQSVWSGSQRNLANQQPRLVSARYERKPRPSVAQSSAMVVHVTARAAGQTTYVYYNGGSMLGIAPLRVRFNRPGRHRLTFFTPRLASWSERWVTVRGRGPQRLAVRMTPGQNLARAR